MTDLALKALPTVWRNGKRYVRAGWIRFRLPQLQKNVPSDEALKTSAFSVLGGSIERVIAFRDYSNARLRMLVSRRPFEQSYEWQVFLLEEFGSSFRVVWDNPQHWWVSHPSRIRVADLDRDGIHEIYAVSVDYGTGGGSENLHSFVPARNAYYNISWQMNWQSWDATPVPRIVADFDDSVMLQVLERVARGFGLCRPNPQIDLHDPQNAVLRWRKENGNTINGRVRIHRYPGAPAYPWKAPEVATLEDGIRGFAPQRQVEVCRLVVQDWIFVGHFKGPVFAFDRRTTEHFVLWSPPSMYEWPTALLYDSDKLYIGSRGQGLLRYDLNTSLLVQSKKFGETNISEIQSIRLLKTVETLLEVGVPNTATTIPVSYLDELQRLVALRAGVRSGNQ